MAHTSVTVSGTTCRADREVVSSQADGATVTDLLRATYGADVVLAAPRDGSGAWCHVERPDGTFVAHLWGYFGTLGDLAPAHLR